MCGHLHSHQCPTGQVRALARPTAVTPTPPLAPQSHWPLSPPGIIMGKRLGEVRIIVEPEGLGHSGGQEEERAHTSLSLGALPGANKMPFTAQCRASCQNYQQHLVFYQSIFTYMTSDLISDHSHHGLALLAPATPVSLLYKEHARHSAPGPLHRPVPGPEYFPQVCMWLTPQLPSPQGCSVSPQGGLPPHRALCPSPPCLLRFNGHFLPCSIVTYLFHLLSTSP